MTPLIPTRTRRVAISFSKVTNGCVTPVNKNICSWTKHEALCPRPVCICLQEVFTFLIFVIFLPSPFATQDRPKVTLE